MLFSRSSSVPLSVFSVTYPENTRPPAGLYEIFTYSYYIHKEVVKTVVNIKKLEQKAIIPSRGSDCAAGLDLFAHIPGGSQRIPPGKTRMIGTGIAVEIPQGYFGAVFARSGLASKRGLRPANCVGVIDSDYRGEIIVALHNDNGGTETIGNGDRIAQLIIMPYLPVQWNEIAELDRTKRADGGFGSTGVSGNIID